MRARSILATIVAPLAAACGGGGGDGITEPGDAPVASVTITPDERTAAPGDTFTLFATAKDAQGKPLNGRPITWRSLNPAAATVTAAGRVQAQSEGVAMITATVGGRAGAPP